MRVFLPKSVTITYGETFFFPLWLQFKSRLAQKGAARAWSTSRLRDTCFSPHCRPKPVTATESFTGEWVWGWPRYHAPHRSVQWIIIASIHVTLNPVPPWNLDAPSIFGEAILSLSLLSACVMKFTNVETGHTVDVLLRKWTRAKPKLPKFHIYTIFIIYFLQLGDRCLLWRAKLDMIISTRFPKIWSRLYRMAPPSNDRDEYRSHSDKSSRLQVNALNRKHAEFF